MKTISNIRSTVMGAVLLVFCVSVVNAKDGEPKGTKSEKTEKNEQVLICHAPPGNPSAKQDLWVSPSAVAAHLAHGDVMGSCDEKPIQCGDCKYSYLSCYAMANGDKDAILQCQIELKECLSNCVSGEPAPAPAPAEPGGK